MVLDPSWHGRPDDSDDEPELRFAQFQNGQAFAKFVDETPEHHFQEVLEKKRKTAVEDYYDREFFKPKYDYPELDHEISSLERRLQDLKAQRKRLYESVFAQMIRALIHLYDGLKEQEKSKQLPCKVCKPRTAQWQILREIKPGEVCGKLGYTEEEIMKTCSAIQTYAWMYRDW
ncbi:hypothetical protein NA57DRAFT_73211 [Rhizodiscina lignyota]|uniref:Uncharacterized protein n=1 Tax=Rhizodiscina lignyota TaxID=1504668 RepID=A0A9P4M8K2_9PEZI|nr:hypothetical protein NA57DRAFT_73211 [Rhizodiscina lignyota]